MTWRRREVIAGLAGLATVPSGAWALGDATKVGVAELDLGAGTTTRPEAWKRLLYHVETSTSVEVRATSERVTPESAELFEHPFCVLLGTGAFAPLSDRGIEQLSQFLAYGGFLFVDDTTGDDSSGLDASVRRLATRLFPTRPLAPLPADHSVLRAFFLLDRCPGRLDRHAFLEGVTVGNLCPLVYCRNDVSGALDRTPDGVDLRPCVPGGEAQRREAVKVGINLLMYALTANYKNDQAHVRQLMLDRRLK